MIALPEIVVSRIVSKTIFPRLRLNDISSFAAKSFVMLQDVNYVARVTPFEKNSQRNGIFNRLICALPEVWKHRVGGISEKCKTPKPEADVPAIYELLGVAENGAELPRWAPLYESGLAAYRSQDFAGAAKLFQQVVSAKGSDRPAQVMLERCREFLQSPPGEDWQATNAMKVK